MDELHHRIDTTAKDRYIADKRLKLHGNWSTWTITISSILLIVFSLLAGFKIQTKLSEEWLSIVQVMLAVFVLSYSLIFTTKNYALQSYKMHKCGLELSNLLFAVHAAREDKNDDLKFAQLSNEYSLILSRYDNHDEIDHKKMKLSNPDEYRLKFRKKLATRVEYYLGYSHYIMLLLAELLVLVYTFH